MDSEPKSKGLDSKGSERRQVMKAVGKAVGAGAVIASVGLPALEYKRRHDERLRNLGRIVSFLYGETPGETISIRGRKLDYPAFIKICRDTVGIETDSVGGVSLEQIVKDYGTMVSVEEMHGPSFHTNPLVDDAWLQMTRVKGVPSRGPIVASYGYAQMQAGSARTTALKYRDGLATQGFLTSQEADFLSKNPGVDDYKIATLLRLKEDDSVFYGASSFIELYQQYKSKK